ncbi:hypothetical protein [Thauera linaloolentis]|uniref:TadE family protein n=1 Tax=Thauera linaloolentis (strain DSM 12138 / JCM 21573 / CCUG 41526 / CIP 105981 / IAM 15112 / NBRC 102519 / 47Lol) TaxID=1123367 RepID=N6XUA6_THAL4|nr:hypothetical protein [Thauera linaloolentis]ENO85316.1 hypothetical protein C666_15575 [Thauera linaloolentis 47Lol = DSM 12138]MCM8565959.1 hypothetical protein [Thauera linaloolentis]
MADAALRPLRRRPRQRGAIAVEAAYILPVLITAAMMFMELANIGLTINMGATALERAVQQFRRDDSVALDPDAMKALLPQRMATASHGYLGEDDIAAVTVESFTSLDAMGGGSAAQDDDHTHGDDIPAWRITVDIRKNFITPLPRLLSIDSSAFRYRYQEVLAYLPPEDQAQ